VNDDNAYLWPIKPGPLASAWANPIEAEPARQIRTHIDLVVTFRMITSLKQGNNPLPKHLFAPFHPKTTQEKGPIEARSRFLTEPCTKAMDERFAAK
jgi:hypothetical protein